MPAIVPEIMPFLEAIKFWQSKVPLSRSIYLQLNAEAKQKAFSMAGINKLDELNTVYQALGDATKNGIQFVDFCDSIRNVIEDHGWTGPKLWRVWNTYRTGLQVNYNAGRYSQMLEETADRPYWMYSAINDDRTRPAHLALDGKVARYDDPFWDHFYPPNGFMCRCQVISLSLEEVQDMGLKVQTGEELYNRPYESKDRGIVVQALLPDEGWDLNPAKIGWDPDMSKYPQALQDAFAKYMQGV